MERRKTASESIVRPCNVSIGTLCSTNRKDEGSGPCMRRTERLHAQTQQEDRRIVMRVHKIASNAAAFRVIVTLLTLTASLTTGRVQELIQARSIDIVINQLMSSTKILTAWMVFMVLQAISEASVCAIRRSRLRQISWPMIHLGLVDWALPLMTDLTLTKNRSKMMVTATHRLISSWPYDPCPSHPIPTCVRRLS